ncbi:MAG: adenylate/guanylate cyclase domain-containing protein [Deltaproteobacteria bacterium]|uniref:Adenylate/guanylate cyclase domain-containing protein n=1 Tax=Candidatus Zymogenus saltonus TaxID=2844893 RepID=A0A9D8PM65_9DELT|nr:adenylate/guanylate cyclase domain-containing protein [Candidatus Zymogenus saltonus]
MKSRTGLVIGIAISILIILLGRFGIGFIDSVESKILDFRFLARGKIDPGGQVIVIAIDEKTLDELGRWPFPRSYFVDVIRNLNKNGVKVLGFDMIFSEPDIYSGITTIDYIQKEVKKDELNDSKLNSILSNARDKLDNDRHLSMEMKNTPEAILGYFFHSKRDAIAHLTDEDIERNIRSLEKSRFRLIHYDSEVAKKTPFRQGLSPEPNIPAISEAADGFGYFNVFPDGDGTIRWSPLTMKCGDIFYPSLALEMARAYLEAPAPEIYISEDGAYKIVLGDIEIPTDSRGELLINYRGSVKTFPHYSFYDVLKNSVPKEVLENKIAIIGTVAVGTYDLRVTPMGSDFPGMEVNANIIDNILNRDFLSVPPWSPYFNLLVVIMIGTVMGLVTPRVSAWRGALVAIAITGLWAITAEYLFREMGIWIAILPPLLTIALCYTVLTLIRYITVERAGRQIKNAFQFYVSESVVREILKDPSMLTLGGERKDISVLFSDIKGFTSLSEGLLAEDLVQILNEYLTKMTDVVFSHMGLLDKYIGDAIMAVYGAPLAQPDHHLRACLTALDMRAELMELQKEWEITGRPKLEIRIGINSGHAVVGNMGSKKRFDYTVLGDNVNLASRLENLNKVYNTKILISENTYVNVKDEISVRELDLVRVRGKTIPVKIYEMIGRKGVNPEREEMAEAFHRGLEETRKRNWEAALKIFVDLSNKYHQDVPTSLYIDRIREAISNPPPDDWDGVF